MAIQNMKMFSLQDVRRAFDDAASRIIPLAQYPPQTIEQIREYFVQILFLRSLGDDSFPNAVESINVDINETKTDREKKK